MNIQETTDQENSSSGVIISNATLEQNSSYVDSPSLRDTLSQDQLLSRQTTCHHSTYEPDSSTSSSVQLDPTTLSPNSLSTADISQGVNQIQTTPSSITSNLPPLRRSNRISKPIEPRSAWQPKSPILYVGGDTSIPQSYSEAINGPDKAMWEMAIQEELDSLSQKGVFTSVTHVPHKRRAIGSRWVFTVKSDGRFKARLVAQGFNQIPGVDYFDTAIGKFTKLTSKQPISRAIFKSLYT